MSDTFDIYKCDDGSVLIELYRDGGRIGFTLEVKPEDSGWYVVHNDAALPNTWGTYSADELLKLKAVLESMIDRDEAAATVTAAEAAAPPQVRR